MMIETSNILKGVVHGRTIELDQDPGFPEGAKVDIAVVGSSKLPKGILEAFGVAAHKPEEVDEFLRQTYADRENDPRNRVEL